MGIIKKQLLFSFVFFTIVSCSIAQVQNTTIVTKNGENYYKYIVKEGNTLWGIHNLYKVPVEEIIKSNPGIENGITAGQIVFVPVKKQNSSEQKKEEHIVQRGETLYGIAKQYGVDVEQLLKLNPEAKKGVKIGQILVVPHKQRQIETVKQGEIHIVEKGETLYGIAHAYNIPVEKLLNKNPEAKNGLQVGQILNLPENSANSQIVEQTNKQTKVEGEIQFHDSIVRHTVLSEETLYSISKRFMVSIDTLVELNHIKHNRIHPGEVLLIPLKKVDLSNVKIREVPSLTFDSTNNMFKFHKKNHYEILIFLPMNYDKNQAALSGLSVNAQLNPYTNASISFYMGIKMALDSLQQYGLNASIRLVDTQLDSNLILNTLNELKNKKLDLIIGPLMPKMIRVAARWSETNKVPLLSLAAAPSILLQKNNYFFSSVPSDIRLLEGMADDLAIHHNQDNLILVTSGKAADKKNYTLFKTRFNNTLNKIGKQVQLKEVGYKNGLSALVKKDKNNIFICPTQDRVVVSYFMTAMNKIRNSKQEDVKISVYGIKEWENFNELKLNYKLKLNLHYPSSISLNYQDSSVVDFIHLFRKKYQTDPNKYAIQGFDVAFYFASHFLMGTPIEGEAVMNDFHYAKRGLHNGVENNNVFILRYDGFEIREQSRVYE